MTLTPRRLMDPDGFWIAFEEEVPRGRMGLDQDLEP